MGRLRAGIFVGFVSVLTAFTAGCGHDVTPELTQAIGQARATRPSGVPRVTWTDVEKFYADRHDAPVWVDGDGPNGRGTAARGVVQSAVVHGLEPDNYGTREWSSLAARIDATDDDHDRIRLLARLDLRITAALLELGHDVAIGRRRPESLDPLWQSERKPPDVVGSLEVAAGSQSRLEDWLEDLQPPHPEYKALQGLLANLVAQRERGGGPAEAGQIPLARRIALVALNLERWRWVPDDLGDRHFLVNIPAFDVVARENGHVVLRTRAVVGKPDRRTPVFSDTMTTIVFSPYWHIPESIVTAETVPKMEADPDYLSRNHIEILRVSDSKSEPVDPDDVDWDDATALDDLAFRQKPGAQNSLGLVKFLFPNRFDVYMHDTPADSLFKRSGRAFSHGCVRLEEPAKVAQYVLRNDPDWDPQRIGKAMHGGVERQVALHEPIPVHIVYFTVWIDETGTAHYYPDVYGYDRAMRGL